ncbi:hypothetical protein [Vagococcus intermedius]|uniref:Sigma-70 region 4 domain-containing protein n=1 Tax=Vagococcus intermedius TaxID=2991418 RepID=A0AAF0IAD1_9ENTE|nr:hypothetical protein [Vagococcus intermedius]WEG74387.1 sigma-70 region 4 domain-containing protein [Vagococcus intermedius]WEG76508.1 sigma-70 region 4 domain-containing protein [Vagococcus intermedius]
MITKPHYSEKFKDEIRSLFVIKRLTYKEISEELGCSISTVQRTITDKISVACKKKKPVNYSLGEVESIYSDNEWLVIEGLKCQVIRKHKNTVTVRYGDKTGVYSLKENKLVSGLIAPTDNVMRRKRLYSSTFYKN